MWVRKAWYYLFMAFLIYGRCTATFNHFVAEEQPRQQQGCWPVSPPPSGPPRCGLHSTVARVPRDELSSAEEKPFSFQLRRKSHPGALVRDQLLFPACTAPGSCGAAATIHTPTRKQPHRPLRFCMVWRERGSPPEMEAPSSRMQGPIILLHSSFHNMKLLNKCDECPLPTRAMQKTLSRSLTAKVILFVKKKGKHYH